MGFRVFYGDATRLDILHSAGASEARILIIAIDDQATSCKLAATAGKHFPNLTVMSRAHNNSDAYALMEHNVQQVYRESLDSSVRLGIDVLSQLGFRRYSATRAAQKFISYDEAAVQKLAQHRHDQKQYIHSTREEIKMQEQLLANDRDVIHNLNDHAWESDTSNAMEKKTD
jgi:CPA2 family monovalent cation:H+ antiporter-2